MLLNYLPIKDFMLNYENKTMDQVDDFKVKKVIKKLPKYIQNKFARWIESIQKDGWLFVKDIGNYRDHALKGSLKDQRSARLG